MSGRVLSRAGRPWLSVKPVPHPARPHRLRSAGRVRLESGFRRPGCGAPGGARLDHHGSRSRCRWPSWCSCRFLRGRRACTRQAPGASKGHDSRNLTSCPRMPSVKHRARIGASNSSVCGWTLCGEDMRVSRNPSMREQVLGGARRDPDCPACGKASAHLCAKDMLWYNVLALRSSAGVRRVCSEGSVGPMREPAEPLPPQNLKVCCYTRRHAIESERDSFRRHELHPSLMEGEHSAELPLDKATRCP